MRRLIVIFLLTLIFVLSVGCSDESGDRIRMPSSSRNYKDANVHDVVTELTKAGFSNIETEALRDLVTGWLTKDGQIEHVSVNGDTTFSTDSKYPIDAKIVVTYHTFPEKEASEPERAIPSLSPTEQAVETETPDNESDAEQPDINIESIDETGILTVNNCEDMANLFSIVADYDPRYKEFSEVYRGRTIEFDGRIDYVNNHSTFSIIDGSTKTSEYDYDIIIKYGDYDPDNWTGPIMRIESISNRQLGFVVSKSLPDYISVGNNVRVVARVGSYNEENGIFDMHYESITPR